MSEHRKPGGAEHVDRESHLQWVYVAEMRTSPTAQRRYRKAHAETYAADFHLEALGYPVLSRRDGHWFIVDGQHRVAALKLIGWADQMIQCECYDGLTEEQEAELFLERNDVRAVTTFDKFRVALTAQRATELDIDRTVRAQGLKVARGGQEGCTAAVAALAAVYGQGGPVVLGRTLRLLRDSYGASNQALRSEMIEGVGLVCVRYNGDFDDDDAVRKLATLPGGLGGLQTKAGAERAQTGRTKAECIAAAVVDVVNRGRARGRKLPRWWEGETKPKAADA